MYLYTCYSKILVFMYICELKVDIFGIIIVSVLMKTKQIRVF